MLIKYERGFISQMKYLFSTHYSTVKRRQDSILWAHATIYTDSLKQRTMTTYITLIAFIFKCVSYFKLIKNCEKWVKVNPFCPIQMFGCTSTIFLNYLDTFINN